MLPKDSKLRRIGERKLSSMKKDWIMSLGFLTVLVVIIAGTGFLPVAGVTIEATVVLDPEKINLSNPAGWSSPSMVATLTFPKPYRDQLVNINASTVLLDGVIPPSTTVSDPNRFKAFFDKGVVIDYLWLKVYHLGYQPPFKNIPVELTVTGKLYDGTPFSGSDIVYLSAR